MMNFETICKMTQKELKVKLAEELTRYYDNITVADGYIYAEGNLPIMLVAHMDTVHKEPVKQIVHIDEGNIISSPQGIGGDDRCGIYMILDIIKTHRCHVLFTEDEEIGGIGASKFTDSELCEELQDQFMYIIELDRKGNNDAVFYECDNPDFEEFIIGDESDFKFDTGSYSDIVEIAPALGVAAVNLSCGYYNAHTLQEYVNLKEMHENIDKVKRILDRTTANDYYEYIEREPDLHDYWSWDNRAWTPKLMEWYILAETKEGEEYEEVFYAESPEEAVGKFLMTYPELCFNDIVQMLSEEDLV